MPRQLPSPLSPPPLSLSLVSRKNSPVFTLCVLWESFLENASLWLHTVTQGKHTLTIPVSIIGMLCARFHLQDRSFIFFQKATDKRKNEKKRLGFADTLRRTRCNASFENKVCAVSANIDLGARVVHWAMAFGANTVHVSSQNIFTLDDTVTHQHAAV